MMFSKRYHDTLHQNALFVNELTNALSRKLDQSTLIKGADEGVSCERARFNEKKKNDLPNIRERICNAN